MVDNAILKYLMYDEAEKRLTIDTPKLSSLMGIVSDSYDELIAVLTDSQKSLLDKFRDALENYHFEENYRYFIEGFKAGFNIVLAAKPD